MSPILLNECTRQVLETVPLVMRTVRAEMRRHRAADLSVPQFRTLAFLDRQAGASLAQVAEHIGLTPPSMSSLIEGLVERKLVLRNTHATDRRRVTLMLTARGRSALEAAHGATQAALAEKLAALSAQDRIVVVQAMQALRPLFEHDSNRLTATDGVR
jgi:DNA-binding MarR family transcriptional regulator